MGGGARSPGGALHRRRSCCGLQRNGENPFHHRPLRMDLARLPPVCHRPAPVDGDQVRSDLCPGVVLLRLPLGGLRALLQFPSQGPFPVDSLGGEPERRVQRDLRGAADPQSERSLRLHPPHAGKLHRQHGTAGDVRSLGGHGLPEQHLPPRGLRQGGGGLPPRPAGASRQHPSPCCQRLGTLGLHHPGGDPLPGCGCGRDGSRRLAERGGAASSPSRRHRLPSRPGPFGDGALQRRARRLPGVEMDGRTEESRDRGRAPRGP